MLRRLPDSMHLSRYGSSLNWLEKGYEERFNPGVLLRPGFDPLRSDPRFQNLVRRIAYPDEICVICAVTETCCLRHSSSANSESEISFSIQLEIKQTRITAAMLQRFSCAYRQNDSRSGKILCERSKSGELSARHVHSVTGQRS